MAFYNAQAIAAWASQILRIVDNSGALAHTYHNKRNSELINSLLGLPKVGYDYISPNTFILDQTFLSFMKMHSQKGYYCNKFFWDFENHQNWI